MHKKINVLLSLCFIAFGATSRVLWLLGVQLIFMLVTNGYVAVFSCFLQLGV